MALAGVIRHAPPVGAIALHNEIFPRRERAFR